MRKRLSVDFDGHRLLAISGRSPIVDPFGNRALLWPLPPNRCDNVAASDSTVARAGERMPLSTIEDLRRED